MNDPEDFVRDVVEYKVRRALAFKTLREIRTMADEINRDERVHQRARLVTVLSLVVVLLTAASLTVWPSISRFVAGVLLR